MNSLKEAFSWKNMLKNLNFFCELNLGLILTAVGIVYFKNPNHFCIWRHLGPVNSAGRPVPPDQRGRLHVDHQPDSGSAGLRLSGHQDHGLDDLLFLRAVLFRVGVRVALSRQRFHER